MSKRSASARKKSRRGVRKMVKFQLFEVLHKHMIGIREVISGQ